MNKLLKSVRPSSKKDDVIKESITTNLSVTVKEIQYAGVEESKANRIIDISEAINQLCSTVEAIFLHGLKDSLRHKFKRALADVDERPDPNFWSPLLVISHRQIIDQILNLSQITTEVGQCRAWVRLVLNDCLLSSYLLTIRQDLSTLKSFYNTNAYIRDADHLEVAQKFIEGVEAFKTFTLHSNSSLLNTWPLQSLILSGIWAPTLKNCPIAACDDVALIIEETSKEQVHSSQEESSDTVSLCSAISSGSQASGLKPVTLLSEDDVLKIILGENKDSTISEAPRFSSDYSETEHDKNIIEDNLNHNVGNSLKGKGWSFDEKQEEEDTSQKQIEPEENKVLINKEKKSVEGSFTALIESYNTLSDTSIRTTNIREVWKKFEDERLSEPLQHITENQEISAPTITNLSPMKSEAMSLAVQLGKIANERGLDVQDFECAGCKQPLSIEHKPNVCHYTGEYYCNACMHEEAVSIPARIIHNWDFEKYSVSRKSFNYINEIKDHPVIDFKILNPYIYGAVEEMAQLQIMRNQLNYLRAYLYTCREPIIEQLQKQMWPREYMYEHIHQYSISDLHEIQNNVLAQELEKVVQFGKNHVSNCWLCSQKGFVCEICTKPKALFPFDVDNVYKCEMCNAVYHKHCLNSSKPCPKCERRKKREELPLLSAIRVE
ncbi:pleckstrin homology and RUN domain containing M1 [Rhynchophorus ferrugineus]|uniref:pleckstrin homology and RUN domain containing M1 n=1 Tax=Rhynchophorus ferrugineus TaxID=354439 RepID=UPI003FCCDD88